MPYNFADFVVDFKVYNNYKNNSMKNFETQKTPEVIFQITPKDVEFEKKVAEIELTENACIFTAMNRKISEWLPLNNAFLLHSSVIDVDGIGGVAFAAQSGTGKTTHTLLWQRLLGHKMQIINGDKPIVRFFCDADEPYAFGTPWNGKEGFGGNTSTILNHICFIERAKTNSCEKIDAKDVLELILNQVYMPKQPQAALNTIKLINCLLEKCTLWKIKCNTDISAAEIAYKTILGEQNET